MTENKRLNDVSRRSILKAAGTASGTAIAGGALTGTGAANHSGCDELADARSQSPGPDLCRGAVSANCQYLGKVETPGASDCVDLGDYETPEGADTVVLKASNWCFTHNKTSGEVCTPKDCDHGVSHIEYYRCTDDSGPTCRECDPAGQGAVKYEFVESEEGCGFELEGSGNEALIDNVTYESKSDEECEPISVCFDTAYCTVEVRVKAGRTTQTYTLDADDGEVCFDTPATNRAISNFTVKCA